VLKDMIFDFLRKLRFNRNNKRILAMDWVSATPIKNIRPTKIESIVFVIPKVAAFSGGLTSIFRLGSYLYEQGYKVTYASYDGTQSKQEMYSAASLCLENFKGEVVNLSDITDSDKFDVVIATNVISVYYATRLNGYKMTFVQDYEPFFYEAGDWNYLALKSYELGFHMVSLGEWNKHMILKNVDESLNIDTITFPYEKSEYKYKPRDFAGYKEKDSYKICIYFRETPRRLPGICQIIVKKLKEKFAADNKELQVFYYGSERKLSDGGKNLGRLSKQQLNELYQECDFGLVASYTNISLVPYEMMATGLPIIEIASGSFPFFFTDAAFLFDLNYDKLYEEIKYAIENPDILIERDKRIQNTLDKLSWQATAEEFNQILKNLIK